MPVQNKKIADKLIQLADLMDIKGESQFRIRAYRNAAQSISGSSRNLSEMVINGEKISKLPEIGESIAHKIEEIVKTGELQQLEKLKKEIPVQLTEIMKLEQLGPHRTKILHDKLNVDSLDDLKKVAKEGKVEGIKGFGKKSAAKILHEIDEYAEKGGSKRIKLNEAEMQVAPLINYLKQNTEEIAVAGSYRRFKETIGDIDLVGVSKNPEAAMEAFADYEDVDHVLSKGKTRSSVVLVSGLQVDLRIVGRESFGAALLYFTGSRKHTIALRKAALQKDLKMNEYGIFKGESQMAGKTEKEMYETLGFQFIPPEMRENKGELEAAEKNQLPDLVTLADMKGDLQTHTTESDGTYSLEEMVKAAQKLGYEYYAVTDHSKKVAMANGLDEKRVAQQIEKINALNRRINSITILKSIEVDILEDGTLDLSNDILKQLDVVVCSIHYNRNLSKKKQTMRVLKAMENPYFNILAHPTGRLINERSGYEIDMKEIMKEAKDKGCFLEINANPKRLDLNDDYARMAKEIELKLSISTDAHSTGNLNFMKYGVAQARRGWLEKDDILNTRTWKELKKLLKR